MFVRRDAQAAERDLRQSFEKLKSRVGDQIKGGLYISCIARGPNMFGRQNAELELIRDIFGGVPLVGLYANGEISITVSHTIQVCSRYLFKLSWMHR